MLAVVIVVMKISLMIKPSLMEEIGKTTMHLLIMGSISFIHVYLNLMYLTSLLNPKLSSMISLSIKVPILQHNNPPIRL